MWRRAVVERAEARWSSRLRSWRCHMYSAERMAFMSTGEVDFVVEADHRPCALSLPNPDPSEIDRTVGTAHHIAGNRGMAPVFRSGLGGMPNAVCCLLLDAGGEGDLGIHHRDDDGRPRPALPFWLGQPDPGRRWIQARQTLHRSRWARTLFMRQPTATRTGTAYQVDYTNSPHIIMHGGEREGSLYQQHHAGRFAGDR